MSKSLQNQENENQERLTALQFRVDELEQLDSERRQAAAALTSLLHLSHTLVSTYEVDVVLDQAIQAAVKIADVADHGSIQILDEDWGVLKTAAIDSGEKRQLKETISFQPGVGIAGTALMTGQTVNVPDVLADDRFIKGQLPLRFRSLLVAPLVFQDKRLGTISLSSEKAAAFSKAHEDFIRLIADQTAVTLENARLFTEREYARAELQAHRDQLEEIVKERTQELELEIVERKRVEAALVASEKRYRAIVEDQTELISRFLPDGTLTFVNEAFCRYVGKKREEILGQNFLSFLPEDNHKKVTEYLATLSLENPVLTYEHQTIKNGQEPRWQRSTDRAIFDDQQQVIEYQSVGRDITEAKNLEKQLLQSQKMEAIGRLAGGIAHDFNNILTVVTAYSNILLYHLDDPEELQRGIIEISKAGDRGAALTRQLLAFSRKQVLQPKELNLNAIITDMGSMLRHLIGESINLSTSPDPNLGLIEADSGQIEQVIMNLVINARDAMPYGGQIAVETTNVTLDEAYTRQQVDVAPGPYVLLKVSDTGQGMNTETLSHIFEPFFTTKEDGTGLGLATTFGIVKQSKGHIQVDSQPGLGTTFSLYLPSLEDFEVPTIVAKKWVGSPHGSETVLLVEDEGSVRDLARLILEDQGYTVLEAAHGEAALQIFANYESAIHLLLTDVVMPGGLNGREVADRLTAMQPTLKVLYISGYTQDAFVHHGLLDAEPELLQKPFTSDQLAFKVREILDTD